MKDLLTLTKIKNGDVKAFEQVFRLYYMPLCIFAASITGRMDIAEEIVQELFYVFWKERERLQLFHTIKSYLYGAVRNQSLQYWEHQDVRNRYRDAILSHPDKDDTPDDPQEQIEYKELEALVNRTLESFPNVVSAYSGCIVSKERNMRKSLPASPFQSKQSRPK